MDINIIISDLNEIAEDSVCTGTGKAEVDQWSSANEDELYEMKV